MALTRALRETQHTGVRDCVPSDEKHASMPCHAAPCRRDQVQKFVVRLRDFFRESVYIRRKDFDVLGAETVALAERVNPRVEHRQKCCGSTRCGGVKRSATGALAGRGEVLVGLEGEHCPEALCVLDGLELRAADQNQSVVLDHEMALKLQARSGQWRRFCVGIDLSTTDPSSAIGGNGLLDAMIATLKDLSGKLFRNEFAVAFQPCNSSDGR